MVADVDDDVEAEAAVGGDAVVEGGEEGDDEGLEVGALAAGAQADAGEEVRRQARVLGVDAEVDPGAPGRAWRARTIEDLPERGAPFRMTIRPGAGLGPGSGGGTVRR